MLFLFKIYVNYIDFLRFQGLIYDHYNFFTKFKSNSSIGNFYKLMNL